MIKKKGENLVKKGDVYYIVDYATNKAFIETLVISSVSKDYVIVKEYIPCLRVLTATQTRIRNPVNMSSYTKVPCAIFEKLPVSLTEKQAIVKAYKSADTKADREKIMKLWNQEAR